MVDIRFEFCGDDVFHFLHNTFGVLRPEYGVAQSDLNQLLMQKSVVKVVTPIGVRCMRFSHRVLEIIQFCNPSTGQPLTYIGSRGFSGDQDGDLERVSQISVHCPDAQMKSPRGNFSGPALMQSPDKIPADQRNSDAAKVVMMVLYDFGRVLNRTPPDMHPDSIKNLSIALTGPK